MTIHITNTRKKPTGKVLRKELNAPRSGTQRKAAVKPDDAGVRKQRDS